MIERLSPDAPTLLEFRRLLECVGQPAGIFAMIREHLGKQGLILREGTIVDATLIAAPRSTKNIEHKRDADMHQTKNGNQLHFGMKAHIGVDAQTGLGHSMVATVANESDVSQTHTLLHGEEKPVHADAGYQDAKKREALKDCMAEFVVSRRRSTYKKLDETNPVRKLIEEADHAKASIRSTVEHVFHVVKNLFRHRKCRHKGLAKSTAQFARAFRDGESGVFSAIAVRAVQDSCVLMARNRDIGPRNGSESMVRR